MLFQKRVEEKVTVRGKVKIPVEGGEATFVSFRGLPDQKEHIALVFGEVGPLPLVRIHSECLTGDVFLSGKCDCGEQLREATREMQNTGGILLYLRQEGRGIGLYNKLDAYQLQAKGHDTYEANRMLGFKEDHRNYQSAALMLEALGSRRIRLLSNNPDKKKQLEAYGISVSEAVSTGAYVKDSNASYLAAKVTQTQHRIAHPLLDGLLQKSGLQKSVKEA
jgi:GTP cyclohydrolase II